MLQQSSHSVSFESTFARELAIAQVAALAGLLAADPKLDPEQALGALLLRLQRDRDQLDASDRKVLRALDERVAAALAQHPDLMIRDYAQLLVEPADPEANRAAVQAIRDAQGMTGAIPVPARFP